MMGQRERERDEMRLGKQRESEGNENGLFELSCWIWFVRW